MTDELDFVFYDVLGTLCVVASPCQSVKTKRKKFTSFAPAK